MTIMDSVDSKTGDFYQATPGVGADGKNIMKLIVRSQISQPASNSRMSGRPSGQLPVTAQSLGQSLQIPPNAQVRTFPASELLLGIQKEISVSSANTSSSSGSSKESKPHLKLIPKISQRPNSPIKWVIEEEDSSTTPTPDPVKSSVISEILRVVAERENAKKHGDDFSKPVSGLSQEKSGPEQENPVAKCKEKCFFVAENGSQPSEMGKGASPTGNRKSSDSNETIIPLSKQSLESASPGKRPALRSLPPGESDEVIVQKDEDANIDSSQQAAFFHTAVVTQTDKDKVFVSYIPPESESRQDLRLKTQMALVKETDQMGTTSWGFSASPTECTKTGDFYQATPGVRADGKNIMTLIVGSQICQPASNSRMSGRPSGQLPVTAQSLAVLGGQSLQIPPNAQVRTFPASKLLLGIQKEISVSSAYTSSSSGSASVVPVSSTTTLSPVVTPQSNSALQFFKLHCKTSDETLCGPPSKGSKPHLKLIPKVSQRPNSPIKWVIEEEDSSTTPTPDPVKSSVMSEILRVVAERENAKKHDDDFSKPVSGLSQEKSGPEQENPVAKCKGKCFFVAKNYSRPSEMGKSASPSGERKNSDSNETIIPLSKQSLESASPGKRPALRSLPPGESDEVIVLKDEDAYIDSSQQAAFVQTAAVTQTDKDKVFVSYIPPKSESRQDLRLKTQMALVKETDQMGTTSWGFSALPTECTKTGDFYQATPGVGADGKNIMTVIVGSHISQPKTDPTPQKAVTINTASAPDGMLKKAATNPSATQQIVRKQIPPMSALPYPGGVDPGNSLNKHPLQQQQVKSATTEPLMVTPASNSRMSGRPLGQLPVTAQSLAVRGGQSLQIPPNAQVRTFPASELPLGIQKEISVSSANTSSSTGSSKQSKPHLKLIPKVSQRPNSPIKWVIEEEDSSTTPTPDPVKSSVISEILRVVAERENAKKHDDDFSKPVSGLGQVRVSIPPKSESTQDLRLKTQRQILEETDQRSKSHSNCVTEYRGLGGKTFDVKRRKAGFNMSVNKVQNLVVLGPAVLNRSSQKQKGIHKMQSSVRPTNIRTSSLVPESCEMADNLLRKIFGITANVNICLQRIDGASAGSLPAEPLKSESEGAVETHVDPACRLDLSSPQEADGRNDLINVKRVKVKMEQELSEDFTTPCSHTDIGLLKCSHFEQKKHRSGNASCDVKTEPVMNYMEPIDEDLISTDKSFVPNSWDTAPGQTFVDLNTNTRRMDRKRKRTMCPCCASGTQDPAAKSGEPEKWAQMTKHKGKKGGRTKTVSKQVKSSERINRLTAKTKHSCKTCGVPDSDHSSTSSMGCNEEIKRLKELLKEKEAALEMLRNTMS